MNTSQDNLGSSSEVHEYLVLVFTVTEFIILSVPGQSLGVANRGQSVQMQEIPHRLFIACLLFMHIVEIGASEISTNFFTPLASF